MSTATDQAIGRTSEQRRPRRLLLTGSRTWTDAWLIASALEHWLGALGDHTVLVHGACPTGADAIAHRLWHTQAGLPVETHPADWAAHGRRAGFIRNAAMVRAGADACLAFVVGGSRGASMSANLAERAGIPVQRFELDTGEQPHCFPSLRAHTVPHRACILR